MKWKLFFCQNCCQTSSFNSKSYSEFNFYIIKNEESLFLKWNLKIPKSENVRFSESDFKIWSKIRVIEIVGAPM